MVLLAVSVCWRCVVADKMQLNIRGGSLPNSCKQTGTQHIVLAIMDKLFATHVHQLHMKPCKCAPANGKFTKTLPNKRVLALKAGRNRAVIRKASKRKHRCTNALQVFLRADYYA